jgi:hypothetical protein
MANASFKKLAKVENQELYVYQFSCQDQVSVLWESTRSQLRVFDNTGKSTGTFESYSGLANPPGKHNALMMLAGTAVSNATADRTQLFIGPKTGHVEKWEWVLQDANWKKTDTLPFNA